MREFKRYDLVIANPDSDIDIESLMGKYKNCPFFIDKCEDGYIYIEDENLNLKLPSEAFMLVYDYVSNIYGFKRGDKVFNKVSHKEIVILDFEQYFHNPFEDDSMCDIAIVHGDDNYRSGLRNTLSNINDFISQKEIRNLTIDNILEDV